MAWWGGVGGPYDFSVSPRPFCFSFKAKGLDQGLTIGINLVFYMNNFFLSAMAPETMEVERADKASWNVFQIIKWKRLKLYFVYLIKEGQCSLR